MSEANMELDMEYVKHTLELRDIKRKKVLELRAIACSVAAEVRAIDKLLTPEVMKEFDEWTKLLEVYK